VRGSVRDRGGGVRGGGLVSAQGACGGNEKVYQTSEFFKTQMGESIKETEQLQNAKNTCKNKYIA